MVTEYNLCHELGRAPRVGDFLNRFPEYRNQLLNRLDDRSAATDTTTRRAGPGRHRQVANWQKACPPLCRLAWAYTLHKLLGKGGMGAVYLAQDNAIDRSVALKIPASAATRAGQIGALPPRSAGRGHALPSEPLSRL